MRSAIFVFGMMVATALQMLAESNGYEPRGDTDASSAFFAVMFVLFLIMDIFELSDKIRR